MRESPSQFSTSVTILDRDSNQFAELIEWITSTTPTPLALLDVGGGGSYYDFTAKLREMSKRIVGVDPDPTVLDRPWFDEAYVASVEDYSQSRAHVQAPPLFDVALCVYVLEHVQDPLGFFSAIRSTLSINGACFGVTPNLWHYFGVCSKLASKTGTEDWLLRKVRASDLIDAYHSPVHYRINSIRALTKVAHAAGFSSLEIKALEQPGMFETYFPVSLRWFPRTYSRLVNRVGHPSLFGTLLFRLA